MLSLPAVVAELRRACEIGPLDHLDLAHRRTALRLMLDLNFLRFGQLGPPVRTVSDYVIDSAAGELRVRLYRSDDDPFQAAHLFLHGGGWWQGSIDDLVNDATCRYRAATAGVTVVAVEYRLSPEHRFPAALEDCRAALRWIVEESAQLGIDPANLSVGGNSAGANLAAALTLACRDDAHPQLVIQILEVPALDLTLQTMRRALLATDPPEALSELRLASAYYLDNPAQAYDPLASPLRARDLAGLPPALIYTAEHDPLRAEGQAYGQRLRAAGVPTCVVQVDGALHGSALLTRAWEPASTWQTDVAMTLRRAHKSARTGELIDST